MNKRVIAQGLAWCAAFGATTFAYADDVAATSTTSSQTTDSATAAADPDWKVAIGPGFYLSPAYPGARRLKVYPFPSLDISYKDRVFSQGPDVLGVNVIAS